MRWRRILLAMSLLGAGFALAGCETFDLEQIWSSKKPLKGERREIFPQGVPGVQQGVPPELVQGYQAPPDTPPQPPPGTAELEKPKPAPRRASPPPRPANTAAGQQPRPQQQAQQPPEQPTQQSGAAWPDPPSRTASQPQQSGPAWPDPPRPGTTTR